MYNDDFLDKKLDERKEQNAFRRLKVAGNKIDFCSNDYLGIVHHGLLNNPSPHSRHGSTGSRLLTGNSHLAERAEQQIADFHKGKAALIFNSGYDANVGLLSSIAQKGDTILYDQLVHASIRDGIRLSFAQAFSFVHNNPNDLEKKLNSATGNIFVVTESVFSMDGDVCPLKELLVVVNKYQAHLIIDEAHAIGVLGEMGEGLAQSLHLHEQCFARVYTFGKACGCHGAVIVGSNRLKDYLVNFSRSLIFTTALPDVALQAIINSYEVFPLLLSERAHLKILIEQFQSTSTQYTRLVSNTPIQAIVVPGNHEVKEMAATLSQNNYDVRPILYPTVPKGKERLRIILHAYNSQQELHQLLQILS